MLITEDNAVFISSLFDPHAEQPEHLVHLLTKSQLGAVHILRNTGWGGDLPDLLQYYKGKGGVFRDPKFVLRNIWTAQ